MVMAYCTPALMAESRQSYRTFLKTHLGALLQPGCCLCYISQQHLLCGVWRAGIRNPAGKNAEILNLFAVCVIEGRINSSKRERYICIVSQECTPEVKTRLAWMCPFLLLPWGSCGEGVCFWAKRWCYGPNSVVAVFPRSSVGLSWPHSLYSGKQ